MKKCVEMLMQMSIARKSMTLNLGESSPMTTSGIQEEKSSKGCVHSHGVLRQRSPVWDFSGYPIYGFTRFTQSLVLLSLEEMGYHPSSCNCTVSESLYLECRVQLAMGRRWQCSKSIGEVPVLSPQDNGPFLVYDFPDDLVESWLQKLRMVAWFAGRKNNQTISNVFIS